MRDPLNDTNSAAVTQLDVGDRPRFKRVELLPTGVSMSLAGRIGGVYRLDVSPDLTNWLPLDTWTNVTGVVEMQDTTQSNLGRLFYSADVK